MKEAARFVSRVTFQLEFEFKKFYTLHIQHLVLHVKVDTFCTCLIFLTN
jgi:hypothetical protein